MESPAIPGRFNTGFDNIMVETPIFFRDQRIPRINIRETDPKKEGA
jgi:hypothetical protein